MIRKINCQSYSKIIVNVVNPEGLNDIKLNMINKSSGLFVNNRFSINNNRLSGLSENSLMKTMDERTAHGPSIFIPNGISDERGQS